MSNPKIVMVVDDDPDVREALAEVLTDAGFQVLQAENGLIALHRLVDREAPMPFLIVLDIGMRVMSGIEFLTIARSYRNLSRIPVVVVSALRRPERQPSDNVAAWFQKPVDLEEVMALIRQHAPSPTLH